MISRVGSGVSTGGSSVPLSGFSQEIAIEKQPIRRRRYFKIVFIYSIQYF
jgi:hypothetical protein